MVSVFLENKVGNQDSVALEIRMQDRLKYDASAPTLLAPTPTPTPNFELYKNVRCQRGMFQFWSKIYRSKVFLAVKP